MRTLNLIIVMVLVLTATVYTEDATVLPAKTLHVDADASTGFVSKGWNEHSERVNTPSATIVGATIGVSYGFTEWFTAAFDWSPGVTDTDLTSIDVGNDGNSAEEIYEGLGDFALKGRFQVVGHNAPIPSERFRVRVTPSVVIPFPGIDDKDALGAHTWGVGGDVSFDTLIADNFFVNIFSEVYLFPLRNQSKTNNQWEFSLEASPHYAVTIGTVSLAFALPVNWNVTQGHGESMLIDGISAHVLSLRPSLALRLTRPLAINIEIEYILPLYGKNNYIAHTITVKAPVNFNLAKNKEGEQR
ncbi:MAG: hypothetical protein LBL06_01120 [Treponema sp.]|nr:hypothetical protein [Treponema sp.]